MWTEDFIHRILIFIFDDTANNNQTYLAPWPKTEYSVVVVILLPATTTTSGRRVVRQGHEIRIVLITVQQRVHRPITAIIILRICYYVVYSEQYRTPGCVQTRSHTLYQTKDRLAGTCTTDGCSTWADKRYQSITGSSQDSQSSSGLHPPYAGFRWALTDPGWTDSTQRTRIWTGRGPPDCPGGRSFSRN